MSELSADKYIYAGVEVPEAISAFSNKYGDRVWTF